MGLAIYIGVNAFQKIALGAEAFKPWFKVGFSAFAIICCTVGIVRRVRFSKAISEDQEQQANAANQPKPVEDPRPKE